ncbi:type II secretion system protein, partial [bacterium]|nr:type II secretion system protein [bacterium]
GQEGKRVETSLVKGRGTASAVEGFSSDKQSPLPFPPLTRGVKATAFTLAEVLITLGIIGIVAAMTLPALVQHYRKVEYSARLKKFYSSMNQAILLSEVNNGSPSDWNKVYSIYDDDGNFDYNANGEHTYNLFMKYLAPYIKYTKIEQGKIEIDEDGNQKVSSTTVYFADGSTAWLWNGDCIDMGFDVNGKSKPNQSGRDLFRFLICPTPGFASYHCGSSNRVFCSYHGETTTRTNILNACKSNSTYCSGLLMHDGWEFKDDYPYKL